MIGLTRAVRVFAYTAPTDMRRSYNGLESLVRREMGHDIMDGDLFLFINRRRNRAKVLFFDGTGLCILMKRMEQRGRFASLWKDADKIEMRMTPSELSIFLEGGKVVGQIPLILPDLTKDSLAVSRKI
jgi:transposase